MQQRQVAIGAFLAGVALGAVPHQGGLQQRWWWLNKDKDHSTATSTEQTSSSVISVNDKSESTTTSVALPTGNDKDKDDKDGYKSDKPSIPLGFPGKDSSAIDKSTGLSTALTSSEVGITGSNKDNDKTGLSIPATTSSLGKDSSASSTKNLPEPMQSDKPSITELSGIKEETGSGSGPVSTSSLVLGSSSANKDKTSPEPKTSLSDKTVSSAEKAESLSTESVASGTRPSLGPEKSEIGKEATPNPDTDTALTSTVTLDRQGSVTLSLGSPESSASSNAGSQATSSGLHVTATVVPLSESNTSLVRPVANSSSKSQRLISFPEKGSSDANSPTKSYFPSKPELTIVSTVASTTFPGYVVVSGPASSSYAAEKPSNSPTTPDKSVIRNATSASILPVWTPAMLGNAYGGGFIITPSIYVTIVPYSSPAEQGVPPGYGSLETTVVPIGNSSTQALLPSGSSGIVPAKDNIEPSSSPVNPSLGLPSSVNEGSNISGLFSNGMGVQPTPSSQLGTGSPFQSPSSESDQEANPGSGLTQSTNESIVPTMGPEVSTGVIGPEKSENGAGDKNGSTTGGSPTAPTPNQASASDQGGLPTPTKDSEVQEASSSPSTGTAASLAPPGGTKAQIDLKPSSTRGLSPSVPKKDISIGGSNPPAGGSQASNGPNADNSNESSGNSNPGSLATPAVSGVSSGITASAEPSKADITPAAGATSGGSQQVAPVMTAPEVSSIPSDLANFLKGIGISVTGVAGPKSPSAREEVDVGPTGLGSSPSNAVNVPKKDTKPTGLASAEQNQQPTSTAEAEKTTEGVPTDDSGKDIGVGQKNAQASPNANAGVDKTNNGPSAATNNPGANQQNTNTALINTPSQGPTSPSSGNDNENSGGKAIGSPVVTQGSSLGIQLNGLTPGVTPLPPGDASLGPAISSGALLPTAAGSKGSVNVSLPLGPAPYAFEGNATVVSASVYAWLVIFAFAYLFL